MTLPITGVFCASATPLDARLAPDLGALVDHCERLLDDGCDGIALLGTTGEANSFSVAERKTILEGVVKAGIEPEKLLPGTGVAAIPETVELTRHALSLGVRTVVMLPPYYYKGPSIEGLFLAYARIIEDVADDRLRVILYHIPQMSGVPIPHDLIARLRAAFPATFVGIKDSAGDINNMLEMIAKFPGFSVLAGADPLLLPLVRQGGAGCITATSNLLARDLAFVLANADREERSSEVDAAQERIVAYRTLSNEYAQLPTIKAMIAARTGRPGWSRVRPPLVQLRGEEAAALQSRLAAMAEPH